MDRRTIEKATASEIERRMIEMAVTSEVLVSSEGLNQVLHALAGRALEVARGDFAAIATFDEFGQLERFAYAGLGEEHARQLGPPPRGRGLLGQLVRRESPMRCTDVGEDPHFTGWPAGHPPMGPFLGIPIRAGGRAIGSLYITRAKGAEPFSDEEAAAATFLGLQAATGVWSVQAREREGRVAVLEERASIAHDLHDGTIQGLYALGLEFDTHSRRATLPEETRAMLVLGVDRLNQLISDIRQYIMMLEAEAPPTVPDLARDLPFALRQLVPPGIDTVLNVTAAALQELSPRAAEDLLYIAREALSNAVRHAKPTKIAVDFRQSANETLLTIQDNGIGFDPSTARTGLGTVSMRTRAERLGAHLTIVAIPGMGTTVRVSIPRRDSD